MPWDLHPALTAERLIIAARLLVRGREDALAQADYWAGDDSWSIGCRAYSFSRHQLQRAAQAGRFPWLGVMDATHHFVFMIEGVPVRFFRGEAEEPNKRTLRQRQVESDQLSLAFGSADHDGLMFRLALETDSSGRVSRVVFLALRGEEGATRCFWPVPYAEAAAPAEEAPKRRHATPGLQLALLPETTSRRPSRRRAQPPLQANG